jgi:hypothetical protein
MPFSDQPAPVAVLGEDVGNEPLAGEVVDAFLAHAAGADPVLDSVPGRYVARQQRGARRRAYGRGAEEILEADAGGRQPVEHRRPDLVIAGATQRPRALVVADDEEDIRSKGIATGQDVLRPGHACRRVRNYLDFGPIRGQ